MASSDKVYASRAWEAGLDDIVTFTDTTLEQLAHERSRKSNLPQFIVNPKRSASVPRNVSGARLAEHRDQHGDSEMAAAHAGHNLRVATATTTIAPTESDRKIDLLLRRTKLMGEKIRQMEKDAETTASALTDSREAMSQLSEGRKQDKKLILSLKDQITTLKTSLDNLTTVKGDRHMFSHPEPPTGVAVTAVDDDNYNLKTSIVSTIKSDLYKDIKEWARVCLNEQTEVLSKFIERRMADDRRSQQQTTSGAHTALSDSEKELLKLKADFERIKIRQSSLDSVYSELREGVNIREKEAEDRHRRVISSHKLDMHNLVDSVSRKVNESIVQMEKSVASLNIPELRRHHDHLAVRLESMHHEAFSRLAAMENDHRALIGHVERLSSGEFVNDVLFGFDSDSDQGLRGQQYPFDAYRRAINEQLSQSQHKIEHLDALATKVASSTAESLRECRGKVDAMDKRQTEHLDDYKRTVELLIEAGKKTRRKVKDVSACVSDVGHLGNKVEDILRHIDARNTEEYTGVGSMSAQSMARSLKSMEVRLLALETENDQNRGNSNNNISSHSVVQASVANATAAIGVVTGRVMTLESQVARLEDSVSASLSNQHTQPNDSGAYASEASFSRLRDDVDERIDSLQADISLQCLSMIQSQTAYLSENLRRLEDTVVSFKRADSGTAPDPGGSEWQPLRYVTDALPLSPSLAGNVNVKDEAVQQDRTFEIREPVVLRRVDSGPSHSHWESASNVGDHGSVLGDRDNDHGSQERRTEPSAVAVAAIRHQLNVKKERHRSDFRRAIFA